MDHAFDPTEYLDKNLLNRLEFGSTNSTQIGSLEWFENFQNLSYSWQKMRSKRKRNFGTKIMFY